MSVILNNKQDGIYKYRCEYFKKNTLKKEVVE